MKSQLLNYVSESLNSTRKDVYLLDSAVSDVTGDGTLDNIYLVENKESSDTIYADNINLIVEDGDTHTYLS